MKWVNDLKLYAGFAWGLPGFLRHSMSLAEAQAVVQRRLAERETAFLRIVERGIFGYPRSPYLPLLRLARCAWGDIQAMARRQGVEGTLRALREAGVYITFEEFKGRTPLIRDGQVIPVQPRDFDTPYLRRMFEAETGGSTGAGTRVELALDHVTAVTAQMVVCWQPHGGLNAPTALWYGILPDSSGFGTLLANTRLGNPPQKWFSPLGDADLTPPLKYRLATYASVAVGRAMGLRFPWPEVVPLDQAATVARWAAQTAHARGQAVVAANVSMALRVALAAHELGLDLTGVVFRSGGEPPTEAKVRAITRTGARFVPLYGAVDVGLAGVGCGQPCDVTDVHFLKDSLALIQGPRQVADGVTVPAFLFTTLLPSSPKLLLNVESDDYGVVETRACGCPLAACGYTEHLRAVHSFRKLTGEGVTLIGSDMVRILEEVLPTRFGGGPLDYQLVEEEDEQGFTRLSLLVSPRIDIADEQAVIDVVLEALRQSDMAAHVASAVWRQAGTLRVQRREPIWTARGKLMPLHLARRKSFRQH